MRATAILISIFALAGCKEPLPMREPDQCLRAQLFQQCLQTVPNGPMATKYTDWSEVVQACESASYYQSLRQTQNIKQECRL